jgi:hypothetical protein
MSGRMPEDQTAPDFGKPSGAERQAAELARQEILSPTLATTKEVLAVHTPVLEDGQPLIARADTAREPGAFYFYFRLEGEPYYLVVVVWLGDKGLAVGCSCIEAAVRVFLLIKSKNLSPDEITRRLGLEPTAAQAKGTQLHKGLAPLAQTLWRFEPHKTLPEEVGRKLDLLLHQLDGAAPRIAALATECDVTLTMCYEGCKEWLGGWTADARTLKRLAALGCSLELDLFASGPDFQGN